MIKKLVQYTMSTPIVGSEYMETFEMEFDDDMSDEEIQEELDESYEIWVWEFLDGSVNIIDEDV